MLPKTGKKEEEEEKRKRKKEIKKKLIPLSNISLLAEFIDVERI